MLGIFIKDDTEITPLPLMVCVIIGTILLYIVSMFIPTTIKANNPQTNLFGDFIEVGKNAYINKQEIVCIQKLEDMERTSITLKSGKYIIVYCNPIEILQKINE